MGFIHLQIEWNPCLGATAPRSPFSLPSILNWICFLTTPPPSPKTNFWVHHWKRLHTCPCLHTLYFVQKVACLMQHPMYSLLKLLFSLASNNILCIHKGRAAVVGNVTMETSSTQPWILRRRKSRRMLHRYKGRFCLFLQFFVLEALPSSFPIHSDRTKCGR
jgi:hypothetical protein